MNNHFILPKVKSTDEPVVIADECGDSMWDAVLSQEVMASDMEEISTNVSLLLNSINAAQEPIAISCDTTVAE